MKMPIHYEATVDVPFTQLLADPLLVLRNLPRVESITKIGHMDYRVVTSPYKVHAALNVSGVGHVKLSVDDNKVIWEKSSEHCDHACNGIIVGEASATENGMTHIKGCISIIDKRINFATWPFIKPLVEGLAKQFTKEFIDNLNDPVFENDVPE